MNKQRRNALRPPGGYVTVRLERHDARALTRISVAVGAVEDALDLSRLVQSAARPGLRDRIRAYRAATAGR